MITHFKSVLQVNTYFYREILDVLEEIKTGKYADIVAAISAEKDKEIRNKIKVARLPAICFCGEFTTRSMAGFVQHSGYICLDFDGYKDDEMAEARAELQDSDYTFACFKSPSGNGFKVIVKIPMCDQADHTAYFNALFEHYKDAHFDISTKDISRVCFASSDPDLYLNEYSKTWTDKIDATGSTMKNNNTPVIILEDHARIITNLLKWINNKFPIVEGSRNSNLLKLVHALNTHGISLDDAISTCLQFEADNFPSTEITKMVERIYKKHSADHGTKYFEDNTKINEVKSAAMSGTPISDIAKSSGVSEDNLKAIIEDSSIFWIRNKKRVLSIDSLALKNWLHEKGIYRHHPHGSNSYLYIKITGNKIDILDLSDVKAIVLNYLITISDKSIYNFFATNTKFFNDQFLNYLDAKEIKLNDDSKGISWLYFDNCAIRINKTDIQEIKYIDLEQPIWSKSIKKHTFNKIDFEGCDFDRFIKNLSDNNDFNELSIKTAIGYLMHGYKDASNNVAVIFNDENIDSVPNGGSGKSLILDAISKVKNIVIEDGKTFSFDSPFRYQKVYPDTQILAFDDVRRGFKFETLFSAITNGMSIEKKNLPGFVLPSSEAPKIAITTNYPIPGASPSFNRRKFDIEISSYYGENRKPIDDFGREFFNEWDAEEWTKFYNYMVSCLQCYLENGIVRSQFKNIAVRKLHSASCEEFVTWSAENKISLDTWIDRRKLYDVFRFDNPDLANNRAMGLTLQKFNKWVESWAKNKGYGYQHKRLVTGEHHYISTVPGGGIADDSNDYSNLEEAPF
ncbi:MAG: BT4734/BF3469 family protein [Bacteroidales bacterium]